MQVIEGACRFTPAADGPTHWVERFRVPDLSVGTYSIPAGGTDDQTAHQEDEIYVVSSGRAILVAGAGSAEVRAGSVVYVPAGEEHAFTGIAEDLTLLVIFAPAYGSRQT